MKIVRVNFLNEFVMAIQNFRVSVDGSSVSAGKLLPKVKKIWKLVGQSNISFLWRVHFPAHASICPIRLVKLRDCRFSTSQETILNILNVLGQYLYLLFTFIFELES